MIGPATPENIKAMRVGAGLSQAEAAAMVYLGAASRWSDCERGASPMDAARWELFVIKCGHHDGYRPARGVAVPKAKAKAAAAA